MQVQLKTQEYYTYTDYLTWGDDVRYELIDGVPYMMSAPTVTHQGISMSLSVIFGSYFEGKKCRVFAAPFDVRLNFDKEDNTVVQPDLVIICDPDKLDDGKSCKGAPDLVVEILSPSTAKMDLLKKRNLYEKYDVKEYWIVDPVGATVDVLLLENGVYQLQDYEKSDIIPVNIFKDLEIDLTRVFV